MLKYMLNIGGRRPTLALYNIIINILDSQRSDEYIDFTKCVFFQVGTYTSFILEK